MKQFYTLLFIISVFGLSAQQNVFWRGNPDGADSGDWIGDNACNEIGSSQSQWFYPGFGGNPARDRPDCSDGSTTRHFLNFDNDQETTMTVNSDVSVCRLIFAATATVSRTISSSTVTIANTNTNTPKIENLSSVLHTINSNLVVNFSTGEINPVNGDLLLTGTINNDGNFIDVFGDNGNTLTISNVVSGSGGLALKQNSILILSGDNTYTGSTFVEAGTLILRGDLADSDITVSSGATLEIDDDVTVKSLTVNAGGNVTINAGESLTITNNLDNSGTVTANSTSTTYSSLIVNGAATGNVIYSRHVNDNGAVNGNDLISAPVSGQAFDIFIGNNTNILANPTGTNVLFGGFDNDNASAPFELWDEGDTTPLTAGVGYRTGIDPLAPSDMVSFEGTVNTSLVQVPIAQGTASILNLIGNPFPSYLDAQLFLSENSSLLDPSAQVIYGYNDSTDGTSAGDYTIISALVNNTLNIAPGQGFFVASNSTGGNIQFTASTPDMRITSTQDDFITGRSSSTTNVKLDLSNASDNFLTDIFFTEFSSLGLDPGYDASLLGGVAPPFSLFTHLVQDDMGLPFAIQALGETDYNDVTIPLGVNANLGEQLTFSIVESSIPSTVNVYLDDTVASTSTLLNSANYVVTPSTSLNGTGRFYLRFMNTSLSTLENTFDNLSIYANQNSRAVNIAGQLTDRTVAHIYDIQGRLVTSKELDPSLRLQSIDVQTFGTGIYLVELTNGNQNKVEKVILK
ncbi:T9SS type A sorting domain-containing protein [Winogradskyella sp.]|uniref:T9SS type A sorting domain-containing protein n=1 Tax=Winogradskyella sp. TaxID=1883156 RepID=UPI00261E5E27|nr:T9SS type A sorting domain-containing protein [Winogradskyella sp.]